MENIPQATNPRPLEFWRAWQDSFIQARGRKGTRCAGAPNMADNFFHLTIYMHPCTGDPTVPLLKTIGSGQGLWPGSALTAILVS